MKRVLKVLNFEIKEAAESDRAFWAVASTEGADRAGDIVRADGWVLDSFMKNPVIPWAHDYDLPPVAKALEVKIVDTALWVKVQFAEPEAYAFADTIYQLYRDGFLHAFSVGFSPIESKPLPTGGTEYLKQELYEISCVTVPANPAALVGMAQKAGVPGENIEALKCWIAAQGHIPKYIADLKAKEAPSRRDELLLGMWERLDSIEGKLKLLDGGLTNQAKGLNSQIEELTEQITSLSEAVDLIEPAKKAIKEPEPKPEPKINFDTLAQGLEKALGKKMKRIVKKEISHRLGSLD